MSTHHGVMNVLLLCAQPQIVQRRVGPRSVDVTDYLPGRHLTIECTPHQLMNLRVFPAIGHCAVPGGCQPHLALSRRQVTSDDPTAPHEVKVRVDLSGVRNVIGVINPCQQQWPSLSLPHTSPAGPPRGTGPPTCLPRPASPQSASPSTGHGTGTPCSTNPG